ncbi:MAG: hypothetical protein KKD44_26985, partial [Proteobacteria bacterium]|nr:hypothetical protein [Pseudomonadota bacterium]
MGINFVCGSTFTVTQEFSIDSIVINSENATFTFDDGYIYIGETFQTVTSATIDNMGVSDTVYADNKYYTFQAQLYDVNGYEYITSGDLAFTDGTNWVNVSYSTVSGWSILEGADYALIRAGTTEVIDDNTIEVTYPIFLKNSLLDSEDVDIYARINCDPLSSYWSEVTGAWRLVSEDYFSIYTLGGDTTIDITGNGGRIIGGDVFEIYAGGDYVPADIFEDNFDNGLLSTVWGIYDYEDSTIETTQDEFSNGLFSCEINDLSSDWSTYLRLIYPEYLTGKVYVEADIYMPTTNLMMEIQTQSSSGYLARIRFNATHIIYWDGDSWEQLQAYSVDTWYEIRVEFDLDNEIYSVFIDEVEQLTDQAVITSATSLWYIRFGSFDDTSTGIAYIDDVTVWRDWAGGTGGEVTVTQEWHNLQALHTQFSIGIPQGSVMINDWFSKGYNSTSYVEASLEYYYDDAWIEGERVRIEIVDGANTGTDVWVKLMMTWYCQENYVKHDFLYAQWESTQSGGTDRFRLWLDLWFNQANASTLIGGRTNAYYYGVKDSSAWWSRWLTGSDWGAMIDKTHESSCFQTLDDGEGNVISSTSLERMRLKFKAYVSNDYQYRLELRNFAIHDPKTTSESMRGIPTPIAVSAIMPNMPQTGFIPSLSAFFGDISKSLWSGFNTIASAITSGIGVGILAFVDQFIYAMDSIIGIFGIENGFSTFLSYITSFFGFLADTLGYTLDLMTST